MTLHIKERLNTIVVSEVDDSVRIVRTYIKNTNGIIYGTFYITSFIPACFALNLAPGPNNLLSINNAAYYGFARSCTEVSVNYLRDYDLF